MRYWSIINIINKTHRYCKRTILFGGLVGCLCSDLRRGHLILVENLDFNLNDDYEVLYLGGGASLQFVMVPFNLMKSENGKAAYLDTGVWAAGAIKEAKKFGSVDVVGSSKEDNYSYVPKDYTVGSDYDYFHCTSNNTIYGTQMKSFPKVDTLMVCDMSSDIFSRELDFSQFDLIYAGDQKNMGPAGATLARLLSDRFKVIALFMIFNQ